ncbi:profilin-1-like [Morone saxatilis]|uniref:profilin-1-like n=1 Tax=Morone saxatilis TaxID=34816 RepID=UPI0015E1D634|nr:profilin-1-like [Morone saxatilis]
MSWDSYIQNLKTADISGNIPVMEAAICGIKAGQESVWASTPGLAGITADEIKKLVGDRSSFRTNGPTLAGIKCMMLRDQMDMEQVYSLDLKTSKIDGHAYSICVGKSLTALVIAQGTKDAQGGQLVSKVFGIVDYLRKANM